ncbi:MAG: hypothetical protein ACLFV7_11285 [Phycisphaerae bacterium]
MQFEQFIQIGLGASVGALAGFLLSRASGCSAAGCRTRANLWYSLVAGAAFGAAAAWVVITR